MLPALRRLLLCVPLLAAGHAVAGDWELVSHEHDLTIYTRMMPGQDLKDFRGIVRVKAPMRTVVQTLVDAEAMPEWFFNMKEARTLDIGGPEGSFLYMVLKGFWPVSDRDAVVRVSTEQDPVTLQLTLRGEAAPDHYPPMRECVRIPRLLASWVVRPLSATETEIRLDGHADPGGSIPVWMANMVVVKMPEVTLRNLRQRLEAHPAPAATLSADPRVAKILAGVKFPESAP